MLVWRLGNMSFEGCMALMGGREMVVSKTMDGNGRSGGRGPLNCDLGTSLVKR